MLISAIVRPILGLGCLGLVLGCGRIGYNPVALQVMDTDAALPPPADAMVDATVACVLGPWSVPQELQGVNSRSDDWGAWLSIDRRTIYFTSNRDGNSDIWMATRLIDSLPFDAPVKVDSLSTDELDADPELSDDQRTIYFRRDVLGVRQIFRSERQRVSDPFPTAAIVPELASGQDMASVALSSDQLLIMVTYERTNLYQATRSRIDEPFGELTEVPGVNSAFLDCCATLSPDGNTVLFDSLRPGDFAGANLWQAQRSTRAEAFSAPVLVQGINSDFYENDAFLSRDGRTLVFDSDRAGTTDYDLYISTRDCQ